MTQDLRAKPDNWQFLLLDYADQSAGDLFPHGVCNDAWTSAPMSRLASTLQEHYLAVTEHEPDAPLAHALGD